MSGENVRSKSENSNRQGHTRVQWAMAVLVNLTFFTYGLQVGWVSPMIKVLQSVESPTGRPLSDAEISLIAGVPSLAAVVGILMLLYVVDTHGRKYAFMVMTLFQSICWIIKLCPSNPTSLLVARVFCGLGAGGCFHIVPMYIKELSQDNIRGTLVSMGILFQNIGILIMYILGGYLSYQTVLYVVVGVPILNMIMFLKAPESPSFLVKKGKLEEAAATIALLRGLDVNDKLVVNEVDSIRREDEYFNSIPNITFINIFKEKAWRRGFIIMVMVFTVHALNGAYPMINYASSVLAGSDVNISPELQSLALPVAMTMGTLFTMTFVDRLGRKMLLGAAFLITSLSFGGVASAMVLQNHGFPSSGWISVVAILVIVCCYGGGVGPIPFIIVSEMFNFQVRAKLMACLTSLAWFLCFVQVTAFSFIAGWFGTHAAFYIFAAINFVGVFIIFIFLPETGNKSVDQIETELRQEKKIKKRDVSG